MYLNLYVKKDDVRECFFYTRHSFNRRCKTLQINIAESFAVLLNYAQRDWFIIYCDAFNHDFSLI